MNELDKNIIKNFKDKFSDLKRKAIVLYGGGDKTKLILDNCGEFNIIGIMDNNSNKTLYGLPILDKEEVINKAFCIILVCISYNANIIYNRIADWTIKNKIPVYHISGKELLPEAENKKATELFCDINEYKKEIENHDVISFGIFDTLITHRFLYSQDLFELMQKELVAKYTYETKFTEFAKTRKQSEQILKETLVGAYTLDDIYKEYVRISKIDSSYIAILSEMELNIEIDNIVPRKEVISLLIQAQSLGKHIILVSDMYLTKKQIESLLDKCGINNKMFNDIYISSEYSKDKYPGKLWEHLRENYGKLTILHFGDNEVNDGKKAKENQIDYLHIHSCFKMAVTLLDSSWMKYKDTFQSRYAMGSFISEIFNSPFRVSKDGTITIETMEEIGRIFFGPVIKCFLDNLYASAKQKMQKIIFQARDCWILKKIADKYYNEYELDNVYLLTSRRAIALVNIKNIEDIQQVYRIFRINSKHTFRRFCNLVFNITTTPDDKYNELYVSEVSSDELEKHLIDNYREQIITASFKQNLSFNKYINNIGIDKNESLAIVNFIGGGVTQLFFEKNDFMNNCEYYYFAMRSQNNTDKLKCHINAIFGNVNAYTSLSNNIVNNLLFGEIILSSPQTQFMGFDENDHFCFVGDGINENYNNIKECHIGIENYIKNNRYIRYDQGVCDMINLIYGYLFNENTLKIKEHFLLYDDAVMSNEKLSIC